MKIEVNDSNNNNSQDPNTSSISESRISAYHTSTKDTGEQLHYEPTEDEEITEVANTEVKAPEERKKRVRPLRRGRGGERMKKREQQEQQEEEEDEEDPDL